MNTPLLNSMIQGYDALAYTHNYIFGFHYKGNVYMSFATAEALPRILKIEKTTTGKGYALRFRPNTKIKMTLLPNATLLCSVAYFEALFSESKYNRGEIFEKLVTEHFGKEWRKDNVPFTVAGDIDLQGVAYQIKYEKATFIDEAGLMRMGG